MTYPNFNEEKKLWKQGYKFVVGLDEAGRGPLAGPVVAAAVFIKINIKNQIPKINDSKKLSEKQREFFYEKLTNNPQIQWGIGTVSEKVIDKINILEATKLAMHKAIKDLSSKIQSFEFLKTGNVFLILDGNFKIKSKIPQKPIIKADEKVFSCTVAGIIAKVTRDGIMRELHKKYPRYGFNNHKGYGTFLHIENLKNFGACKIHRKTFKPIKTIAKI